MFFMKSLLRAQILKQLAALNPQIFQNMSLLGYDKNTPIAVFKSLPNEIDTSLIIKNFKQVLLPEPDPELYAQHILEAGVQLVLVPGLAFDLQGNRLGRGGGYYDRCLAVLRASAKCPQIIGLCLKEQLISEIPVEIHDQKVDKVLCS